MRKKVFSLLATTMFLSFSFVSRANNRIVLEDDSCDGDCFCDAIMIYHATLNYFNDRELAVENATFYLNECFMHDLGLD